MTHCLYNTDWNWARFLRANDIRNDVNFWRRDERGIKLRKGDFFYFKIRGMDIVVGRGQFRELKKMPIAEAWETFGIRNGAPTRERFEEVLNNVLKLEQKKKGIVTCLVIDNISWLQDDKYFKLPEGTFDGHIMASKYFAEDEIPRLSAHFNSLNIRP